MKDRIRYSEAFKLKVMEELRDAKWKSVQEAAKAYGIATNETGTVGDASYTLHRGLDDQDRIASFEIHNSGQASIMNYANHDPIEEDGGENQYAFCWNSPVEFIDIVRQ